jgi:hypothetical protein
MNVARLPIVRGLRPCVLRACLAFALLVPTLASAEESAPAPEDAAVTKARASFVAGAELVKKAQWSEALAEFESSLRLRRHAVTLFNIGACQRAIGQYTAARKTFAAALAMTDAQGGALSESLATESRGYVAEIEGLLARLSITLDPPEAAIAIDGRPLETVTMAEAQLTLVAGLRAPGHGEPPPAATFDVLLNPGPHVITLSRTGFADAVVNRQLAPGSVTPLRLELSKLPATLHVASTVEGAIVTVDGNDVGPTPVDVLRPGGSYRVAVKKKGFVTYETRVLVQPGEKSDLNAPLKPVKPTIVEKWWFWTIIGTAVTGAVVGTYFATRPAAQRPALDCGTLNTCFTSH